MNLLQKIDILNELKKRTRLARMHKEEAEKNGNTKDIAYWSGKHDAYQAIRVFIEGNTAKPKKGR